MYAYPSTFVGSSVPFQLSDLSPEAIFVCQLGKLVFVNRAARHLLDAHDTSELLGTSLLDFIQPEYHAPFRERIQALEAGAAVVTPAEQIWVRLGGTRFDAEVIAAKLMYDGSPAVQLVVRDVSERKFIDALQLGQNRILNMIATGVPLPEILVAIAEFIEDRSGRGLCSISLLNAEGSLLLCEVAPNLPEDYVARCAKVTVGPRGGSSGAAADRAEPVIVTDIARNPLWESHRADAIAHSLKACASWPIFGKYRKILGTCALYFRETVAPNPRELRLFDICAHLAGIAIESRASEERMRYLAHHDGLTSLPNRFLFQEYLNLALHNARRHHREFAVLFLDLDKFKDINDTFGHEAGDQVLREIAERLRGCLRHTDKIARMGGDEFYILIEELPDWHHAADVAQKLLDAASRPLHIHQRKFELSASIGIAIYPDDGGDGPSLLKNADSAMYRVKELGKNSYRFFSVGLDDNPNTQKKTLHPPQPSCVVKRKPAAMGIMAKAMTSGTSNGSDVG